ncbi:hypothetical protein [Dermabacter hominis]|uniref:Uncharacterized protein n=1 Tax=Dermabacter hominis 1368 TaxID=1450519 RepID=A0ABR4SL80_9MICO|nr:hypothetical protein DHOM_10325 [Dermabacter hominis 1368]MDU0938017.1 hypothetical protein [Dermabacter sp.]WIK59985.1 hypothetical protein CYJ49_005895 [Dermabacter hominis]
MITNQNEEQRSATAAAPEPAFPRFDMGHSRVNLDHATGIAAELEDEALAHKLTNGR